MPAKRSYAPDELAAAVAALCRGEGEEKAAFLSALAKTFADLAEKEGFHRAYPGFAPLFKALQENLHRQEAEEAEDDLARMYSYLHGADSAYSKSERRELDAHGGYWCHAGGLSPLFLARPWIHRHTGLADFGAGNGLQGLLFQALYPHRKTTQIELSGAMIEKGRRLQAMMSVAVEKVEWLHKNVVTVEPAAFDFIYIYRPLRPEGAEGRRFYRDFAGLLEQIEHPVTIFSIADGLKDFLGSPFRVFHDDGHLTCFTNSADP